MQSGFLNIRHMRVFVETARTGSVSTAADLCHLSQPAATQAISSLEANFGTALLIRKRQRINPDNVRDTCRTPHQSGPETSTRRGKKRTARSR